jgi:hypothetical protein
MLSAIYAVLELRIRITEAILFLFLLWPVTIGTNGHLITLLSLLKMLGSII